MAQLINQNLITWARERHHLPMESAAKKLGIKADTLDAWETGNEFPNLKQVEKIAEKLYVPLGYLFLDEPPEEKLPIPDFRTLNNQEISTPSPELLAVVHDAQLKQAWLKEIREEEAIDPVLTGARTENTCALEGIASLIREKLEIDKLRSETRHYEKFLGEIITTLDQQGFIVIRNGVVGNNTHRPLNPEEFRGFALYDEFAPLVFINGKDAKAGQIFTIIHELAHLFLGESGLDDTFNKGMEQECNRIAAEVLVPAEQLGTVYQQGKEEEIAKKFKVSRFVILVKARHLDLIDQGYFNQCWEEFNADERGNQHQGSGGDFYNNVKFRAGGENFLNTVINYTLAGKVLYRDAYRLTGLGDKTFNEYCKNIQAI